jgi:hypothetical protein
MAERRRRRREEREERRVGREHYGREETPDEVHRREHLARLDPNVDYSGQDASDGMLHAFWALPLEERDRIMEERLRDDPDPGAGQRQREIEPENRRSWRDVRSRR